MNRQWRILVAILGVIGLGTAVSEHAARRTIERRYREAVVGRQQLERVVKQMTATHQQLQDKVAQERQRAQELAEELVATRAQTEEAVGRLTQEARAVRELQMRLAAVQEQLQQLQGELAVALQDSGGTSAQGRTPVQLERVIVNHPGASELHGRIISVHRDWNFIIVDLGWDTVQIGDTVSVVRNGQVLAKAKVERVQEGLCAATLLPGWPADVVRINDFVRPL